VTTSEGGFLGSTTRSLRPVGLQAESCSSSPTGPPGWQFCLNMLEMALRLANRDRTYEDLALKSSSISLHCHGHDRAMG
jgi:hypothetical protein